jgi:hypothetical protein
MFRRLLLPLADAALATLLSVTPALADEIRMVTGGSVTTTGFSSADLSISGPGFSLSGRLDEGIGDSLTCRPCAPGETIRFVSGWGGDIFGTDQNATVDGHAFNNVFFAGNFQLDAGVATVPNTQSSTLVMQRPFSLAPDSFIVGYTNSQRTIPVFRLNLAGSGTVTLTARRNDSVFENGTLNWVFNDTQPSPTPEPASMLLLLTGVGALAAARRRRRSA